MPETRIFSRSAVLLASAVLSFENSALPPLEILRRSQRRGKRSFGLRGLAGEVAVPEELLEENSVSRLEMRHCLRSVSISRSHLHQKFLLSSHLPNRSSQSSFHEISRCTPQRPDLRDVSSTLKTNRDLIPNVIPRDSRRKVGRNRAD